MTFTAVLENIARSPIATKIGEKLKTDHKLSLLTFCKDLICSPRFLAKTARLGQTETPALRKASAAHVLQLKAEKYLGAAA